MTCPREGVQNAVSRTIRIQICRNFILFITVDSCLMIHFFSFFTASKFDYSEIIRIFAAETK